MRQLYDLSSAPTKKWRPLPGGDHNSSVLEEGYFEAIADFVVECTTADYIQEKKHGMPSL